MKKNKKAFILLVEHSIIICEMLIDCLSSSFYEFEVAGNGMEALNMLKKKKYDLVITDYEMKGINGAVLSGRIKKMYPMIPVIAIGSDDHGQLFNNFGVEAFLKKPFNLSEFKKIIENCLVMK